MAASRGGSKYKKIYANIKRNKHVDVEGKAEVLPARREIRTF